MHNIAMFFMLGFGHCFGRSGIGDEFRSWALLQEWNWGETLRKEMNLKKVKPSNVPNFAHQQKYPSSTLRPAFLFKKLCNEFIRDICLKENTYHAQFYTICCFKTTNQRNVGRNIGKKMTLITLLGLDIKLYSFGSDLWS